MHLFSSPLDADGFRHARTLRPECVVRLLDSAMAAYVQLWRLHRLWQISLCFVISIP